MRTRAIFERSTGVTAMRRRCSTRSSAEAMLMTMQMKPSSENSYRCVHCDACQRVNER